MRLSDLPRPEPAAGVAAYEAELKARLDHDEFCAINYKVFQIQRAQRLAGRGRPTVGYKPVRLDVENVSRCNFACTMCAVSKWPHRKRAKDMSLDSFKRLIDQQPGLVEIKLNGLGEALMQGDDYFEMIRYARARRIWVRITTNASLLHLRDNARKLVESGVNEVDISVDGADAVTFEQIRIGANYERVIKNCALYNRTARIAGRPRAKMWTLVQKLNYARLYDHVKLAADLEFDTVVFSLTLHGWGDPKLAARNAEDQVEVDPDYLYGLVEWGNALGVKARFWTVAEKFSTRSPEKLCPWPFERAVVTSDLRTVPCCMIGDPDQFEIGKGSGFDENWFSTEYEEFRAAHLSGELPDVCKGCYE